MNGWMGMNGWVRTSPTVQTTQVLTESRTMRWAALIFLVTEMPKKLKNAIEKSCTHEGIQGALMLTKLPLLGVGDARKGGEGEGERGQTGGKPAHAASSHHAHHGHNDGGVIRGRHLELVEGIVLAEPVDRVGVTATPARTLSVHRRVARASIPEHRLGIRRMPAFVRGLHGVAEGLHGGEVVGLVDDRDHDGDGNMNMHEDIF